MLFVSVTGKLLNVFWKIEEPTVLTCMISMLKNIVGFVNKLLIVKVKYECILKKVSLQLVRNFLRVLF